MDSGHQEVVVLNHEILYGLLVISSRYILPNHV